MSDVTVPFDESFEKSVSFADAGEQSAVIDLQNHLHSPSYSLAFKDENFIMSDAARGLRIQMEMDKPEWILQQHKIRSTIIVFGSARFVSRHKAEQRLAETQKNLKNNPGDAVLLAALAKDERLLKTSAYYELSRQFTRIVSEDVKKQQPENYDGPFDYVICTGGGPGIMEAANRGAYETGMPSIGLNIKLPYEQRPNMYTSPNLCFQFHYFNVRKLHFMLRAKALVACPGGFGTFDELFEALTLRQTQRMQQIPIVLLGKTFWNTCVNFDYLVEEGVINKDDLELFHITDDPQYAWNVVKAFYG